MIAQQQQEFADQVEQREQLAKRHKEEIAELLQQVDAVYLFICIGLPRLITVRLPPIPIIQYWGRL